MSVVGLDRRGLACPWHHGILRELNDSGGAVILIFLDSHLRRVYNLAIQNQRGLLCGNLFQMGRRVFSIARDMGAIQLVEDAGK